MNILFSLIAIISFYYKKLFGFYKKLKKSKAFLKLKIYLIKTHFSLKQIVNEHNK